MAHAATQNRREEKEGETVTERVIATCAYCKKPVVQGDSFTCLMKNDTHTYIFLHLRLLDEGPNCSELYHRKNGASTPLFEEIT